MPPLICCVKPSHTFAIETYLLFSETFQMQPALATHWKMLGDSLTYKFRINPKAKFSDGKEVTAFDVVASFNLMADEGH